MVLSPDVGKLGQSHKEGYMDWQYGSYSIDFCMRPASHVLFPQRQSQFFSNWMSLIDFLDVGASL